MSASPKMFKLVKLRTLFEGATVNAFVDAKKVIRQAKVIERIEIISIFVFIFNLMQSARFVHREMLCFVFRECVVILVLLSLTYHCYFIITDRVL